MKIATNEIEEMKTGKKARGRYVNTNYVRRGRISKREEATRWGGDGYGDGSMGMVVGICARMGGFRRQIHDRAGKGVANFWQWASGGVGDAQIYI